MNLFFLLFLIFALLLAVNGVQAIRASKPVNGAVSLAAAVAAVLVGHYFFNF